MELQQKLSFGDDLSLVRYPIVVFLGVMVGQIVLSERNTIIIGGLGAIFYFVFCCWSPLRGILLFILLYPLFSTFSVSLGSGIPDIYAGRGGFMIILPAFLLRVILGKIKLKKFTKTELYMGLFVIISMVSIMNSRYGGRFLDSGMPLFDNFIIAFFFYYIIRQVIAGKKEYLSFTDIFLISAIYVSAIGFYEFISSQDLFLVEYDSDAAEYLKGLRVGPSGIMRINGPFTYPEVYGLFLSISAIVMSIYFSISGGGFMEKPRRTFLVMATFLTSILGLFLSMFRSVWGGVLLGFSVRIGISKKKRLKALFVLIVIISTAFIGIQAVNTTTFYHDRITNLGTLYTRFATYKIGYSIFKESPVIGIGFNKFSESIKRYKYESIFKGQDSVKQSHNSYLCILVETGLVGFLLLALVYASIIKKFFKFQRENLHSFRCQVSAIGLGCIACLMFASLFDNYALWGDVNIIFFSIMGAISALLD